MSIGPITSPYFQQGTPWPYFKGPNYTRPVFGENTRNGAFMLSPLVRMPALNGLGALTVPSQCWDALGFKDCHAKALVDAQQLAVKVFPAGTGADYDNLVNNMTDAYVAERCLPLCAAAKPPSGKDPNVSTMPGTVPAAWYSNPLYLGGAIIGGAVVLGLITRYIRSQQGY